MDVVGDQGRQLNVVFYHNGFLKITDFADELITSIGNLDRWPERVKLMQQNWIGKSEGARFVLIFMTMHHLIITLLRFSQHDLIRLFGASFIAIATNHPLALAVSQKMIMPLPLSLNVPNLAHQKQQLRRLKKRDLILA